MEIDSYPDLLEDAPSPESDMDDYLQVYTKLSRFYHRPDIKKLRLDLKEAIRSEWDRAIHQFLLMFGGASHLKATSNVVIGFGNAPVKGHAGPFVRYLINKLRSLGYKISFPWL